MWQEKIEATAAGFQDCPRETKIHRGSCLLLWVELLLPSRQEGVFWRTNNVALKARAMLMAPTATLSTERQLAWSQGHHSVQQQRVMVKMMLWGWKSKQGWCTNAYMTYSIAGRADIVLIHPAEYRGHCSAGNRLWSLNFTTEQVSLHNQSADKQSLRMWYVSILYVKYI